MWTSVSLVKGRPERCGIRGGGWLCGARLSSLSGVSGSVCLCWRPCSVSSQVPCNFSTASLDVSQSVSASCLTAHPPSCCYVLPAGCSYCRDACALESSVVSALCYLPGLWPLGLYSVRREVLNQNRWLPFYLWGSSRPGIEPVSLTSSCIGRWVLQRHLGSCCAEAPPKCPFSHSLFTVADVSFYFFPEFTDICVPSRPLPAFYPSGLSLNALLLWRAKLHEDRDFWVLASLPVLLNKDFCLNNLSTDFINCIQNNTGA